MRYLFALLASLALAGCDTSATTDPMAEPSFSHNNAPPPDCPPGTRAYIAAMTFRPHPRILAWVCR